MEPNLVPFTLEIWLYLYKIFIVRWWCIPAAATYTKEKRSSLSLHKRKPYSWIYRMEHLILKLSCYGDLVVEDCYRQAVIVKMAAVIGT
jgi:hypothetical protein